VVDDFYGDAAGFWGWEGTAFCGVEAGPRFWVDVGFEGGFEALERVLAA
jgi:hypothetical protein